MAKRYDTAGLNLSQLKIPAPQILLPVAIGPLVSSGDEQQPQRPRNSNWFWIWLGIAGVCVLTIALVFAVFGREGDRYHYYYDGPIFAANRIAPDTPATCTVDEVFDDSTRMCIMQAHFPKAVAENIIDTKMDPCTDFYRHACGKWIDAHTNENRGFAGLSAVNSVAIRDIILDAKVSNLNALYASCESTLVDPASKRKQRQQHAIETKLTRDAILGRMLDPLVSVDDLPIVFARMDAAGYTVPVAFVMSSNPKGKGLLPMFAYNGFDAHDQDRDWVRTHFEEIYGSEGPRADQEAVRFIHMASALNVAVPSKAVMDTFAGWKNYVNGTDFEHDTMTWAQFKALTESTGSPFDWSVFVEEMSKTLSLKNLHFGEETQVWAFSREYFSWWHPELFSVEEWKTFITFSVLYQTHDFFPELPNDILFTTSKPVSPLYGRRFKKTRLSASAYGIGKRKSRKQQRWKGRRNGVNGPRDLDDGAVITTDDCIRAAKYMLPGILSKEFLNRKFEQSGEVIRTRVKLMVERIRDRFVRNIMETPWLDNATRVAQADKIRAIIPRVVHPTEWMEETFPLGREMDPSRYLRNVGIIQEERVRRNLALWSESNAGAACDARCRDRITPFGSPLFTVNAWYNPDRQEQSLFVLSTDSFFLPGT
jgi:predicted metalloendopeptidase